MPNPRLLLTIDVEEDMPGWQITDPITVRNARALPRLAQLCKDLGVRPTYLCTYPMVTDPETADLLGELNAEGGCEIGTHLHPWNTPPFRGVPGIDADERTVPYYQFQLGPELFREKLQFLHDAVTGIAGHPPISYRAGRFGIDAPTLGELVKLGYEVDSSVTPLEKHVKDGGPDFSSAPQDPYYPSEHDITKRGDMPILEVPVSVALSRRLPRWIRRTYVELPEITRVRGLLSSDYLGLVDFAWLYPARFSMELMTKAAWTLRAEGSPVLNVFIHSSELVAGASGRIRTEDDVETVFARMRGILEYCLETFDAVPCTLAEVGPGLREWLEFQRHQRT